MYKITRFKIMKRILIAILAALPLAVSAQSEWTVPESAKGTNGEAAAVAKAEKKSEKKNPKYLKGAAPMVNGVVQWTLDLDIPGQSAEKIYDRLYAYMDELTHGEDELTGSQIALVNKKEHSFVTSVREWLLFKKNAISIDRADTSYKLMANCTDNHLKLTLTRIIFDYTENVPGNAGIYRAEEWISDENALNKKGTKVYPGSWKFRKKMIDRKDQIFNEVKALWK